MTEQRNTWTRPSGIFFVILIAAILSYSSESEWRKLVSGQGAFTVLMPGKPKHETRTFAFGGVGVEGHWFSAWSRANAQFTVLYADRSMEPTAPQIEKIFDFLRRALIQGDEARSLSAETRVVKGYPVRQYKAIAEDGSEVDERVYIVKSRLYLLLVVHDRNRDESDVKKFFDSFVFEQKQ